MNPCPAFIHSRNFTSTPWSVLAVLAAVTRNGQESVEAGDSDFALSARISATLIRSCR